MADATKSGKKWWTANKDKTKYSYSSSISDLETIFQERVKAFKKAVTDAGASISIDTTLRSKNRAYVLHSAYKIAKGLVDADKVVARTGVDITWVHGTKGASKTGAQEIITAANVAYKPNMTSNHLKGKAIDWTITWTGTLKIKNKDGAEVEISSEPKHRGLGKTHNGNTDLHAVGKTYSY